jgi:hypothetical protein
LREDHLLEALPGLLAHTNGSRPAVVGCGPPPDPAQQLRQQRLEIVCTHQSRELRREEPREPASPPSPQAQPALALEWNSTDDTMYRRHESITAHDRSVRIACDASTASHKRPHGKIESVG